MSNIFLILDLLIIPIIVILPFAQVRWNRNDLLTKYQRKDLALRYTVLQTKTIKPRIDLDKWEWVSQQVLQIGNFWDGWDWLIDNFYDADTVITGIKGSAKTSIGLRICQDKAAQREVPFTVKEDVLTGRLIILTPELIADDIVPYSVKFIDEIQHCFHRMRTSSTANVEANRFMDLKRKWKVSVVGTMPLITSAEKYLINEKFVFWINCYHNVERRKYAKAVVWFNAHSKDGKYRDWIKLEERRFHWCSKRLYDASFRKWRSKHSDVRQLEDIKKVQLELIAQKERRERNRQIRELLSYKFLTLREKCYLMLDMAIPKLKVEGLLKGYLKKQARDETLTKEEEESNINKNYVSDSEAEIEIEPELVENLSEKILSYIEGERETN